jgi:hypothetical protein
MSKTRIQRLSAAGRKAHEMRKKMDAAREAAKAKGNVPRGQEAQP